MSDDGAIVLRMTDAARTLLDSLSEQQRQIAQWDFPSDEERQRWFYTPTDHGGLTFSDMRPAQHRHVMRLLSTGLSRAGYVTAASIMGLENILDELEGFRIGFGHPRGRDPTRYYLRIFGTPGADTWSWRFGGHHISIHHTIVGGVLRAFTPCFFGADPAVSPLLGGHLLRPLAASADLAFELMRSLSEEQRASAVLSPVPPVDLVGGNRSVIQDGDTPPHLRKIWRDEFTGELLELMNTIQTNEENKIGLTPAHIEAVRFTTKPKGLAAAAMLPAQQEILRALLGTYIQRMPDSLAERESARINGDGFAVLHLAWAGSLTAGKPHYYRIQGERLLVEYDNTTRDANHVHTVWRDPVADFGMDALSAHHRHDH